MPHDKKKRDPLEDVVLQMGNPTPEASRIGATEASPAVKPDTGLHGYVQDNPVLNALLSAGNNLRYGVSEEDRMDMVNKLSAPGVKDHAYDARGIYDPAAAERYTSAYLGGQNWAMPAAAQEAFHAFSGPSREWMNKIGVPGVGEERAALTAAEKAGMAAGATAPPRTPEPPPTPRPGYGLQGAQISAAPESVMDMLKRILGGR